MNLYFSGINGVAIGPLAQISLDAGYNVAGSDINTGIYQESLTKKGAKISIGQDGSQIEKAHSRNPIDWLVYSSALPANHPELIFAEKNNIKTSKRDEFINLLLKESSKKMLAVSGTHGKTTTTAMLVWLFKDFKIPISYSIGAKVPFGESGEFNTDSEYFAYEADEFDRNFLKFNPYCSIVTTVDFDHPDTYDDKADYNQAFSDFLAKTTDAKFIWSIDENKLSSESTDRKTFALKDSDPLIANIDLLGHHNRKNAYQAARLFSYLNPELDLYKIIQRLSSFSRTSRRFEEITQNLYSDYAHHPTEIKSTVSLSRELSDNVVVVYQPHQNKRQLEIMNFGGYRNSFEGVSKIYWLPTHLSRESDKNIIPAKDLISSLDLSSKEKSQKADLDDSLLAHIKGHLKKGDLVVCMSAGSLDAWLKQQFLDS